MSNTTPVLTVHSLHSVPIGKDQPPKTGCLLFDKQSPEPITVAEQAVLYEYEARKINALLLDVLPQGLYTHLCVEMLKSRVQLFIGSALDYERADTCRR